jgi:NDP-sugar pyrophosphorylase family protein
MPRFDRLLLVVLLSTTPSLLRAAEGEPHIKCDIRPDPGDVVLKGKDVIIEAGRTVKDAAAIGGNVIIRMGAKVHSAVAIDGSVTVESGGLVEESALAVHGKVHVMQGGTVKGSRAWIENGLHIIDAEGKRIDLDLVVNGESVGQLAIAAILEHMHACRVGTTETAK